MRPSTFIRLFAIPLAVSAIAEVISNTDLINATATEGLAAVATNAGRDLVQETVGTSGTSSEPGTVFNGKTVPLPREIEGAKFDDTVKSGYWMVEFFSPYCGHCMHFAPTWQTFYEFYYTSEPIPQTSGSGETHNDLNSFTRFYDFKFAKVDCAANGDLCVKKGVKSYPTIILYKDGAEVESKLGGQDLETMSDWIETTLEKIRPGSRPEGGPKLPKVGDHYVETTVVKPVVVSPKNSIDTASRRPALTVNKAPLNPNPEGQSVGLTAETFQNLVTTTRDPWFVKFYAPWCHHCQAMAPNWQEMSRQMKGQLNVGEVNCDIEKRLCKDVKVHGFPTLMFFQGGERIEYDGLRGLGDLIGFANKALAVRDGVIDVTAAEFEELEKREEVLFLYVYDQATTSEDFAALERLILNLVGHAKLVKSKDPLLSERFKINTWPGLLVSRDGKTSYYNALAPKEMRDTRRVLDWIQSVWLPIVPELTASNAREIMNGKLVVLGILSRDRPEEFEVAKREIKNAALEWIDKQEQAFQLERQELRFAKQLRIEEAEDRNDQRALRNAKSIRINMEEIERKEVAFAWIDGVFWERWIRTTFGISVIDGEKVVVNDEVNHRYWDVTMTGNPIVPSRTSILETLPRIVANPPKIQPKSTTTTLGHVWWVIKAQLFEHPRVSFCVGSAILVGVIILGRQYVLDNRGGLIRLSEKGGMNGLLGGNVGGDSKFD